MAAKNMSELQTTPTGAVGSTDDLVLAELFVALMTCFSNHLWLHQQLSFGLEIYYCIVFFQLASSPR